MASPAHCHRCANDDASQCLPIAYLETTFVFTKMRQIIIVSPLVCKVLYTVYSPADGLQNFEITAQICIFPVAKCSARSVSLGNRPATLPMPRYQRTLPLSVQRLSVSKWCRVVHLLRGGARAFSFRGDGACIWDPFFRRKSCGPL